MPIAGSKIETNYNANWKLENYDADLFADLGHVEAPYFT